MNKKLHRKECCRGSSHMIVGFSFNTYFRYSQNNMRWNLSLTCGLSVIPLIFRVTYQQCWHSLSKLLVRVTLNNPIIMSHKLLSGCTLYCAYIVRYDILNHEFHIYRIISASDYFFFCVYKLCLFSQIQQEKVEYQLQQTLYILKI